jgi:bacillopeptidase F
MLGLLLPMQSSAFAAVQPPTAPSSGSDSAAKGVAASRWPAGSAENASAKVDQRVSDAFAASAKPVTYLVKLRAQADVKGAAAQARQLAAPAQKEVQARGAVITALKKTAESSQRGLLADLEQARKAGSVLKVESFWIANIVAVTSTKDVMQRVAHRSDVERIMPNQEIHLIKDAGPLKAAASDQTSQGGPIAMGTPTIQSVEWGIQRIGAPQVWDHYGINGQGAVVASLDTGVDLNHPALHDKWRGLNADGTTDATYSWFDAVGSGPLPYDDHGHGTHTTGTMVGSDGANQIGVAPGAKWIAAKILSSSGSGSSDNIIRAGQWVLAPGGDPSKAPDVVNNSWGGGPGVDDWFRDVVRAWRAAGIFPAFAAGNDGGADGSVSNPGNYPESFAVGAVDSNDNLADFSGRGPSPYDNIMKPQVAAPGVNVRSSVPGGGYEGGWSGTSMATPHVSGTVALLRAANAALTVDQIEQILENSADAKTDSRYPTSPNNGYGHGILNAFNAVAMVIDGVGTVSGRVVTGGDDLQAPVIQHTPVTDSYKRLPIELTANVSDNVSVTNVQLRFRAPGMNWWGTTDMARTAGDFKSGTYTGSIPPDVTQGDSVQYYIQATDYGGNTASSGSAAHPITVALHGGLQPGYSMDFEGATTGWTHGGTNDTWQIGQPTHGPSAAHSGQKVASPSLTQNYPDGADSFLLSPPIDLSGGAAAVSFWHWYDLEPNFDYAYVLATGDGGQTWANLKSFTASSGGNWGQEVVDLSQFAGNGSVFLAFYLHTDSSVGYPGWFVDDFQLYADHTAPATPANLHAASDATGSVTLTWDAVSDADLAHYTVYRTTTSGSNYTSIGTPAHTTLTDTTVTAGTTYYYAVSATDLFNNESPKSAEASVTPTSGTVVFSDDMEGDDHGWTHGGNGDPWQHGVPTSGPNAAHSGTKVWATNLTGNYPNRANASLISSPINLAGLSSATLQFAHWYALEHNYDFGTVEVSTDAGANWTTLATYNSPSQGEPVGWETPTIDLSAYAGRTIQLQFRLASDSSVAFAGWYIDDVRVMGSGASGHSAGRSFSYEGNPAEKSTKPKAAPFTPQIHLPGSGGTKPRSLSTSQVGTSIGSIGIQSLPLDATVTVVETGRVVRTDPANGSFSMMLPAGTFTLRAEAYGYHSQDASVTIQPNTDVPVVLQLTPIPHGRIAGRVTNARTGAPIAGAEVYVDEDPRIPAATTGADGRYSLTVLEGSYTLQVRASGFYPTSGAVTVQGGATATKDVQVEPFVGAPNEIAYDDGSPDNAWGYYAAGNGWGVRMSPPASGQTVMVQGARIFLWDDSWPTPGGNTFQAAIFAAKADGTPGRLLAGPVRVTNATRGGWNDVDFSSYGVTVTGDFFVAYIQDAAYPLIPGMATDESTPKTNRNYQFVSGNWSKYTGDGNFMIRAEVALEVTAPTITTPADGLYTNQAALTVAGLAAKGTTVTLLMDGTQAASITSADNGTWSTPITLTEGAHELTATATVPGSGPGTGTTRPSAPVHVTLDTAAPALTVTSPAEGAPQSSRIIQVAGQAVDPHLRGVTINGTAVTVNADGSFATEIVGSEGANTVTVVATDMAGNQTTVTRHLSTDSQPPSMSNLLPAANATVYTADVVTIAFDSEPGLALAGFQIAVGGLGGTSVMTKPNGTMSLEPGEIALRETRAGHYEAQWTVPAGLSANSAYVRLRAVDAGGNETRMTAPGVLKIVADVRPVAVISGPTTGRVNFLLTFDGRSSTDPDGRIVTYTWDWGDGATSSGSRMFHRWAQPGTYTVRLTVTDNLGATGTATQTVTITR